MKDFLKTFSMYIIKIILSPLKLLKFKNYIMFCTNSGAGFYCNPKYIYLTLKKRKTFSKYKFIWSFKNPKNYTFLKDENTVICKHRSIKYYYYRIVSKIIISNSIEGGEIPKKKKQIKIQTWHGGGCYKKVGLEEKAMSKMFKVRTENNIKNTDIFISSSEVFTKEVIRKNFYYTGKVLEIGMPRNDILFKTDLHKAMRRKILNKYNICEDNYVVLYAPTWRYNENKVENIDFKKMKQHFEKKFNKDVVIIYRTHIKSSNYIINNLINVSNYEDMQELLIASDALISDYSSSIWDYSFLYKPCFLFCPDLNNYIEKRGFVKNIFDWGFPVAKNNEELLKQVDKFNLENYKNNMEKHHKLLKSYENGNANQLLANYLEEKIL